MGNLSQFLNLWYFDGSWFKGTCYKAANWLCTGQTQGTAKKGHLHVKHGNIKNVYLYPLRKDFRNKLIG